MKQENNFEVIPAIDIIDGKCVRLTQGDYRLKTIYNEDPLEVAKQFEDIGIRRLHLVDLDGAKKGEVVNYRVLEQIASETSLQIDFGGGIKSDEILENVFDSGAAIAAVGSVAVKDRGLFLSWLKKYGPGKILLGADVKDEKVSISGWGEQTDIDVFEFISENMRAGVCNAFCTDISKDGLLEGPSFELYRKILAASPGLNLVASGGVSSVGDVEALKKIGCSAVILGKAIYENRISRMELRSFIVC